MYPKFINRLSAERLQIMKIHGLQKMTLLDFPGHVACTVFLGGCDMRCPFCHNAELLDMNAPEVMDDAALLKFLKGRQGLLDGVAITGGEPMMRKDLPKLLEAIRELGFKIKIDTNGNHPELLKSIVGAGLADYIAMDIKNSPERYGETVGLPSFDISKVKESISYLLSGPVKYEFHTTVVKEFHDADSFRGIAEMIKGASDYFLQCFVDRESVPYAGLNAYGKEELESFADIIRPFVKNVEVRGV